MFSGTSPALCVSVIPRISLWMSLGSSDAHGGTFCLQTIIEGIVMKLNSKSGATLAAAAASLFLAGAVVTTSSPANAAQGKCMAANACKGQSACNGGKNSCKGLNACKGNGFSIMTQAQCAATAVKYAPA